MEKIITIFIVLILVILCFYSPSYAKHDFLFLLESAYLIDKSEWEPSFTVQYLDNKKIREVEYEDGQREDKLKIKNTWNWIMATEYGIFDWLNAELKIPFSKVDKKTTIDSDTTTISYLNSSGISDIEAGLKFKILDEKENSLIPSISFCLGVSFPSGNWKKDLGSNHFGFEGGVSISRQINKFILHTNFSGEYMPHAREEGEETKLDEVGFECGLAVVYLATKNIDLILETIGKFETENINGTHNHFTEVYINPGIKYEFEKFIGGFDFGIGAPVGVSYEGYNWGVITKIKKEF
ncbi:MAG: transporter [Candidatus Omnitrophota bacterium]